VPSVPRRRREDWTCNLNIELPPLVDLPRIAGIVPRETNVSRILDAWRCRELNRSKMLRIKPFLTEHSVRGDAMHMLAAGSSREEAAKFVDSRLWRMSEQDRAVIVEDAVRMAANANAFDDIPAVPENVEQQLWHIVDGWRIWTKSDRFKDVSERELIRRYGELDLFRSRGGRNRFRRGPRQILLVRDLKTTRAVRDWHWFGVRLHAVLGKLAANWKGPVLMSIHPTQDDGTPPQFMWLSQRMEEQTMGRLKRTLWEFDLTWEAEIKRLRELFLLHPDTTPEMKEAMTTDLWKFLISRSARRILLADPVLDTNPFRGHAGRHCVDCRRQSVCAAGQLWLDEHPDLRRKPLPPLPVVEETAGEESPADATESGDVPEAV
jgi:hypothetical protein